MKRINDLERYREQVKSVPTDFEEWAFSQYDGFYNFYKGNITLSDDMGNEVKLQGAMWCPVCRKWNEGPEKVKANTRINCPVCGSKGYLYYANKKTAQETTYQTMWLGQKLNDKVYVLRSFVVALVQQSPTVAADEQYRIIWNETRRLYIGCSWWGIEYNNFNWNTQKTYWATSGGDSTNICGPVHPDTYTNAKGSWAEYACLDIARDEGLFDDGINIRGGYGRGPYSYYQRSIFNYLQLYAKDRKVEMLMKLGLAQLVDAKLAKNGGVFNYRAKNPYDYLRIYKSRLKDVQNSPNQVQALKAFQFERERKENWSEDEVEVVMFNYHHCADLKSVTEYMSLKQFANRVKKYSKRESRTPREVCSIYFDYFRVKKQLGYDMHNSIYQFPKNLWQAHDEAVEETENRTLEERLKNAEKVYPNISKRYEKAKKVYSYENGTLMIRPVMSAAEMIQEGRTLHHCVGNERVGYLDKCNEGRDIILVLRKVKAPDVPYVTVEMGADGEVLQWYGIHDSQPDSKKNEAWLKRYVKQLDLKQVENEMKKVKRKRA